VPFYDTGSVEKWLKFWKNLQAIITRQNVTDTHIMYTITKGMLQGDMLMAFENEEGINGPQLEPNYKNMMQGMYKHMFLLQAYTIQTQYIQRELIKSYKISLQTFVARVNKIIDQLEQFPPRDDGTPQVKLT
jgi:hypothetical protein